MRRIMARFWSPLNRGHTGPDLDTYGFREVFATIRTGDNDFTCQVNGQVGGARLIEDFFLVLLCGFDVVDVKVVKPSLSDVLADPVNCEGTYTIVHSRPFLGWGPPGAGGDGRSTLLLPPGDGDGPRGRSVRLLEVPFTARLEGSGEIISHMIFRSAVHRTIAAQPDCPATVRSCLESPEALRAVARLRRAKVRADLITDKTLLGITAKKDTWSSALGIL